jgi:sulfur-oxidizing protein SoxY
MSRHRFRRLVLTVMAALAMVVGSFAAAAQTAATEDPWPDLARTVFGERALLDGTDVIALETPTRAEDAAIVPLTVRSLTPPDPSRYLKALTVVIDENPAPVAATFGFGPKAGVTAISTRVRVNSYTNVHAVAEFSDGKLYMVKTFVKASGGCSAPALKDASAARTQIGEMRLRQFEPASSGSAEASREAQLIIRHPNNSGLQMDQLTHLYIPAHFVDELKITQGDDVILTMQGGISISENPSLRFTFVPNGAPFRAEAVDTERNVYKGEWRAGL